MPLKDALAVVLIVVVALFAVHTLTEGRRGRRWGRN
jgi:hypothetical protein